MKYHHKIYELLQETKPLMVIRVCVFVGGGVSKTNTITARGYKPAVKMKRSFRELQREKVS